MSRKFYIVGVYVFLVLGAVAQAATDHLSQPAGTTGSQDESSSLSFRDRVRYGEKLLEDLQKRHKNGERFGESPKDIDIERGLNESLVKFFKELREIGVRESYNAHFQAIRGLEKEFHEIKENDPEKKKKEAEIIEQIESRYKRLIDVVGDEERKNQEQENKKPSENYIDAKRFFELVNYIRQNMMNMKKNTAEQGDGNVTIAGDSQNPNIDGINCKDGVCKLPSSKPKPTPSPDPIGLAVGIAGGIAGGPIGSIAATAAWEAWKNSGKANPEKPSPTNSIEHERPFVGPPPPTHKLNEENPVTERPPQDKPEPEKPVGQPPPEPPPPQKPTGAQPTQPSTPSQPSNPSAGAPPPTEMPSSSTNSLSSPTNSFTPPATGSMGQAPSPQTPSVTLPKTGTKPNDRKATNSHSPESRAPSSKQTRTNNFEPAMPRNESTTWSSPKFTGFSLSPDSPIRPRGTEFSGTFTDPSGFFETLQKENLPSLEDPDPLPEPRLPIPGVQGPRQVTPPVLGTPDGVNNPVWTSRKLSSIPSAKPSDYKVLSYTGEGEPQKPAPQLNEPTFTQSPKNNVTEPRDPVLEDPSYIYAPNYLPEKPDLGPPSIKIGELEVDLDKNGEPTLTDDQIKQFSGLAAALNVLKPSPTADNGETGILQALPGILSVSNTLPKTKKTGEQVRDLELFLRQVSIKPTDKERLRGIFAIMKAIGR